MSYTPLRQIGGRKSISATTLMGAKGENLLQIPQVLNTQNALIINNYLCAADGQLVKRKGLRRLLDVVSAYTGNLIMEFTSDIWIFGYGTTVSAYTFSTDTVTVIKSNFATSDAFTGARCGDYFFVSNAGEKIGYFGLDLVYHVIATAPKSHCLKLIGTRLYAADSDTDSVRYSEVDTGTNPPFIAAGSWTVGATATAGGQVFFRNGGTPRSILAVGPYVLVLCDKGKYAFQTTTTDVGGILTKVDQFVMSREDFGGAKGAITCAAGTFYANEGGLWLLTALGQQNIPYSDQEAQVGVLLGNKYFDNIDLSNCDITYDAINKNVLVTCAKNSSTNNYVIVYNVVNKSFSRITGWNIARFMNIDSTIYAISSLSPRIYQCFSGSDDDGSAIATEFLQELKLGDLDTRQMLEEVKVQGFLSTSSVIRVRFNIYDVTGRLINDKLILEWTCQMNNNGVDGYNSAQYSSSIYGGDVDYANLIESFDGLKPYIRNFQRIQIHITSGDKLPHIINWVKLTAHVKNTIRRRSMQQIT